uniref:U3 small nucleolar RNA-associated protein 23 n=1 Tax=Tetraselmis sp. GSL018 TaxID=582737 RepID=A0A061R8Q4_9CHLO
MRRKKHKNTSRTVRFFRIAFGFKEPFKVLLDGNFLHAFRITCGRHNSPQEALAKMLNAKIKIFTSKCVTKELRDLGKDFEETFRLAKSVCIGASCEHSGDEWGAAECITDLIGETNAERFFVATQDAELRKRLSKIPGVPCIFVHANGLTLEEASAEQESIAKKVEESYRTIGAAETKILDGVSKRQERTKFRKRKAKGPNPLAVKKPSKKNAAEKKPAASGGGGEPAAGRKRKRPRRRKLLGEAGGTEG